MYSKAGFEFILILSYFHNITNKYYKLRQNDDKIYFALTLIYQANTGNYEIDLKLTHWIRISNLSNNFDFD